MDEAALDKLINEIQEFLRESEAKQAEPEPEAQPAPVQTKASLSPSKSIVRATRAARLLEVCAYAWLAFITGVVCYLIWLEPPKDVGSIAQLLILCTFGVFTTLALIGSAHRLGTLLRIEKGAREIMRLRRRQNAILSRLLDRN